MDFKKTIFNLELMAQDADYDASTCKDEALKANFREAEAVKKLEELIKEFNELTSIRKKAKTDYDANMKLYRHYRATASEYRKAADILKAASD